ncbi:MAG TPA: malonyl-ACP O-methyltransferase BioC [Gammaproteobacteria bacterium]|nr:malonyl-ACP O-methyltransferase BioC [Gammaproteobacteria bacterium]
MNRLSKQRIAQNFSRASAGYEQSAVLQNTVAERMLSRLDLVTVSPDTIIDAGAGTGRAARMLAKRYKRARVLQVDLSAAMLSHSRNNTPRFFSRQFFVCGDVENMPLASHCCQLLFSSMTYQWCNDLDAAFTEATRLLQPNGLFMFATLGPDTLKELRESWATVDDIEHVNTFMDMHDIGDAVVRAGLENVVMDVEIITVQYPDCYTLMRDIKHIGAGNTLAGRMRGLTGKERLQKMIRAYENYRQDDYLPATYEIVYGHAWVPLQGVQHKQDGETFISINNIGGRRGS